MPVAVHLIPWATLARGSPRGLLAVSVSGPLEGPTSLFAGAGAPTTSKQTAFDERGIAG